MGRDKQANADETARLDAHAAAMNGEVAKLEATRNHARESLRAMKDEIRMLRREDDTLRAQVGSGSQGWGMGRASSVGFDGMQKKLVGMWLGRRSCMRACRLWASRSGCLPHIHR